MKIGLFLMTQKGYSVIETLIIKNKKEIIDFVCIGKDSKLDNDYSIEIEKICIKNNLTYFYKNTLDHSNYNSNYFIAVSWRWLLNLPNLIILHDSLLPKYRGFSPLVNMLINGEKKIGVTAIFASEQYDKGDVILQEEIEIKYPIKIKQAISLISQLYSNIIYNIFEFVNEGNTLKGIKQKEEYATYSLWLDDEDYFVDWSISAEKIVRKIDACGSPYEGAKCSLNNKIVIINNALVVQDVKIENRKNGKVIFLNSKYPIVVCGIGLLMITEAVYEENNISIFPLNKFRIQFK